MREKEKKAKGFLYAKDAKILQLSYAQYKGLMKKVEEAEEIQKVKATVLAELQAFLSGKPVAKRSAKAAAAAKKKIPSISDLHLYEPPLPKTKKEEPAPAPQATDAPKIPPIKKEISKHFNEVDESGRLFSVFKQYYTCLNDACGGMMRVTMKDGICSLWNYDEWEEFAFVDIFEGKLRIAVDPAYTDDLKSLSLCEVPRLIATRHNVICVQVDGLNNQVLEVLIRAFNEAGKLAK